MLGPEEQRVLCWSGLRGLDLRLRLVLDLEQPGRQKT